MIVLEDRTALSRDTHFATAPRQVWCWEVHDTDSADHAGLRVRRPVRGEQSAEVKTEQRIVMHQKALARRHRSNKPPSTAAHPISSRQGHR